MNLTNIDPFAQFDELMGRNLPANIRNMQLAAKDAFIPPVDMYETDTAVVVETALAGMNPNDVEVSVEKGMITISGESKKEREVDEKNYYRKETRSGSFSRRIPVPTAFKEDEVAAEFQDGILKITCPKVEPKASKKIMVKVKKN